MPFSSFKSFPLNTLGRDFAVGDIHGMYSLLEQKLAAVNFNPQKDRLFSVGDLVNRGPESSRVMSFLEQPWFHAIKGNHEDIAIRSATDLDYMDLMLRIGGAWLMDKPPKEQARIRQVFDALPLAIQVQTLAGKVGLVHAECPLDSWDDMIFLLKEGKQDALHLEEKLCWSRRRFKERDETPIQGVRALVVGHNVVEGMQIMGNTYYIETGAFLLDREHGMTLLDLTTLKPL